jgi:hypothetical protein
MNQGVSGTVSTSTAPASTLSMAMSAPNHSNNSSSNESKQQLQQRKEKKTKSSNGSISSSVMRRKSGRLERHMRSSLAPLLRNNNVNKPLNPYMYVILTTQSRSYHHDH